MENFAYDSEFDDFENSCFLMRKASKDDMILSGKLILGNDDYLMRGELSILREYYERLGYGSDESASAHSITLGSNDGVYYKNATHGIWVCSPDGTQYLITIYEKEKNRFYIYEVNDATCDDSVPEGELDKYKWAN